MTPQPGKVSVYKENGRWWAVAIDKNNLDSRLISSHGARNHQTALRLALHWLKKDNSLLARSLRGDPYRPGRRPWRDTIREPFRR